MRRIGRHGVRLREPDAARQAGAFDRPAGGIEHHLGDVDAEAFGARIGAGDADQIASGSAADLQDMRPDRQLQLADQLVAAEQIGQPRRIVDVTLPAILSIHPDGGIGHQASSRRLCR
jgi:hypothetical protein